MKWIIKHLIATIVILFFTNVTTFSKTNYVSLTGNDTLGNGTETNPWRTLNYTISKVSTGDVIYVSSGNYNEVLTLNKASVIIDGQGVVQTKRVNISAKDVILRGFFLGKGNWDGWHDGAVIRVLAGADNSKIQSSTIFSQAGKNQYGVSWISGNVTGVTISNCVISNFGPQSVCFVLNGTNTKILNNNIINNPQAEAAFYIWGISNIISGNVISDLNEVGGGGGHPDIFQTFPNNTPSYGHLIENNLIENNTCQLGSLQSSSDGNTNGATKIDSRIRNWTFRNNLFIRIGSKLDVSIPEVKFYNNTFYDCGNYSDAPHVINFNHSKYGLATNCVVSRNIFVLCGSTPENSSKGWYCVDDPYGSLVRNSLTINSNIIAGANFAMKNTNLVGNFPGMRNGFDPVFSYGPGVRRKIALTGTTKINNSTNLFGTNTLFTKELIVGDYIMLGPIFTNNITMVTSIINDTNILVSVPIGNGTTKNILRMQKFDPKFNLKINSPDIIPGAIQ